MKSLTEEKILHAGYPWTVNRLFPIILYLHLLVLHAFRLQQQEHGYQEDYERK